MKYFLRKERLRKPARHCSNEDNIGPIFEKKLEICLNAQKTCKIEEKCHL